MIKTFTQNDVIRYLYKETSDEENAEIESALMCDTELLELYHEMSVIIRQLDKSMKEPDEKIIDHVLAYSKSLNLHAQ